MALAVRSTNAQALSVGNTIPVVLPTFSAGDLLVVVGFVRISGSGYSWSQTAGTGDWTITGPDNNTTTFNTFLAYRLSDGTETDPTFQLSNTGTGRRAYVVLSIQPDSGYVPSIDVDPDPTIVTVAGTSFTAPSNQTSDTDLSLIINALTKSVKSTTAWTVTDPANWSVPAGTPTASYAGTASVFGTYTNVRYRAAQTGTITPGSTDITSGFDGIGNAYHLLVKQRSTTLTIAGAASNTSSASGELTQVATIAGTASSASSASGELTIPSAAGISSIGTPATATQYTSGGTLTADWGTGQTPVAGDLLAVLLTIVGGTTVTAPAAPSGWTKQANPAIDVANRYSITVYTKTAAGSDSAWSATMPAFGLGSAAATPYVLRGVNTSSPIHVYGTATGTTATSLSPTTDSNVTLSGAYALAALTHYYSISNNTGTYTKGSSFTHQADNYGNSWKVHWAHDHTASPTTGQTLADAASWTNTTSNSAGLVVVFAPAATTWSLTGTASSTSSASGTLTLTPAVIAGTASNTSTASGVLTRTAVIAGTSASTSSASGTLTQTEAVAGTSSTTSSASGSLTYRNIAGAATSTSSATGTVTLTPALIAGTSSTTSSATGSLTYRNIAGTSTSTSSASGTVTLTPAVIAGTATAASSAAGTLTLTPALIAGTASSVSTASGAVTLIAVIAGTAFSTSGASGDLTIAAGTTTWTIEGTAGATSTASGAVTLTPATIAGTSSSTSSASGSLISTMALAGTASSDSSASGTIVSLIPIGGTASSTSTADGTLISTLAFAGAATATSTASGEFVLLVALVGTASTTSTADGTLTLTTPIAGTAESISTAAGTFLPETLAGTAATTSDASGELLVITSTGPKYGVSSSVLSGGTGTWVNPDNATGGDNDIYATWTVP